MGGKGEPREWVGLMPRPRKRKSQRKERGSTSEARSSKHRSGLFVLIDPRTKPKETLEAGGSRCGGFGRLPAELGF